MADDEDDPFDAFESPGDQSDDPFEDLSPPGTDGDTGEADTAGDDTADTPTDASTPPGHLPDDPFDRADVDAGDTTTDTESSPTVESSGGDASMEPNDDPFASFSTPQREGGDDPFEAFESAGVDEIDPDAVWEDLESGGGPDADERTYSEVSKHRFCETCEHFSAPPEAECTYEGAAIVEFLDTETVRLLNCPIVAEQRALEGDGVGIDTED